MEVPDNVDILIAGFVCVCVDSSNLNKNAKSLSEVGESADTLRGILEYSKNIAPQSSSWRISWEHRGS